MRAVLTFIVLSTPLTALADAPVVEGVDLRRDGETWTISVTVSHPDTGWDHYADGWVVLAPDGSELGYRTLHHPHVEEQPFTRSLSGVTIPDDVTQVVVHADDSVHGRGPGVTVDLPR
ncbi:hypothetical protein [Jannaschia sp. LMIT008]|uniref:hypothetical protein n=1 Tax=Jannaschia maritima TaxID=3032585 RepID=UPI0028113B75|nr:hypothetical protein [Jannaschia sp. LMIT008]